MSVITILEDDKYDLEKIVDKMELAFSSDRLIRWIYPKEEQYRASFPGFVKLLNSYKLKVCYSKDYGGAAFWLPPDREINRDDFGEYMQKTVSSQDLDRVFNVFEKLIQAHPEVPHYYLALLGVEPKRQGQGYGSSLIHSTLLECDRLQQIAYLETGNPRNIKFYERHGFQKQSIIEVENCPTIFPMIRYPQ